MKLIPVLLSVAFVAAVCAVAAHDETPELPPEDENQAVENPASSMTERHNKRVAGAVIIGVAGLIIGGIGAAAGAAGTGVAIWSSVSGLGRAVAVKNHLGYTISLNCRSGDEDFGYKNLQNGETFMFTFGANIFGRSHYWCSVWAKGAFPVYNEGAPTWQKAVYNMLPDGIYLTDNLDSDKGTWFRGWN